MRSRLIFNCSPVVGLSGEYPNTIPIPPIILSHRSDPLSGGKPAKYEPGHGGQGLAFVHMSAVRGIPEVVVIRWDRRFCSIASFRYAAELGR
jgi:hypothetical protein